MVYKFVRLFVILNGGGQSGVWKKSLPGDPSEKKSKRDTMAGLGEEVGDDLRNLSHTPRHQTNQPKSKR